MELSKATSTDDFSTFKSPLRILLRFFKKSRDNWKRKYMEIKKEIKRFKNQANDQRKSRDEWKRKAKALKARNRELEAIVSQLEAQLDRQFSAENTQDLASTKSSAVLLPCLPTVESSPFEMTVYGHHYSVGHILLFISLVLIASVSLHGASKVFEIIKQYLTPWLQVPHWTTGRWWLLRLGYHKLNRPKEMADDWVWLVDHSCQIGEEKFLVISGIRLCHLPPAGQCLCHEDLEPLELIPVKHSNGRVVYEQLKDTACKTGVPRAILEDHGSDLSKGVELFCQENPRTIALYDIAHKAACMLKRRLDKNPIWKEFCRRAGQTKLEVQQTELAFWTPVNQRSKARYMNLQELLRWGRQTLVILDEKPAEIFQLCTLERFEEKFGWVRQYRESLSEWSLLQDALDTAIHFVRSEGLYRGAEQDLSKQLKRWSGVETTKDLCHELIEFVASQTEVLDHGERLPGSTETLESCFGKYKNLAGDQSKSGITGMILSLGALVSKTTATVIKEALEYCKTKDVKEWVKQKLGKTVQSKRKLAYSQLKIPETKAG